MKTAVRIMATIFLLLLVTILILTALQNRSQSPTVTTGSNTPASITSPDTTETLQPPETTLPQATTLPPQTTLPPVTTILEPTLPPHSELYMEGVSVEDVILYFNEVCLDAEYVSSGTPDLLQKWISPITYYIYGTPTDEDLRVLNNLVEQLNSLEHFPGMIPVDDPLNAVLPIHFCTKQDMNNMMYFSAQEELDGAVTFWYNGAQEITNGIICIRIDLNQQLRNSVIVEEIYNGLGPIQDTVIRTDSIIYQYGSEILSMSEMDILILKLLYHPQLQCGATAAECETVIRQLYY